MFRTIDLDNFDQLVIETPAGPLVVMPNNGKFFITPPLRYTVEDEGTTIIITPRKEN